MTTWHLPARGYAALLLFGACVAAAALALFMAPARAEHAARTVRVHGLSPLPGDAPLPLAWRPPGSLPDDGGPSHVVFPAQKLTIRFNHRLHVGLGAGCGLCHAAAYESRSSRDRLLPDGTRCDGCHATDHADLSRVRGAANDLMAQCAYCHIGYRPEHGNRVERLVMPAPNLLFDHRAHLARNIGCGQCHGAVDRVELATREQLPRMRGCLTCHHAPAPAQGRAGGECTTCHVANAAGRMQTEFASGTLEPPDWMQEMAHDADFIARHREAAGADSRFCANCHSERECVDCHDGRVRPRSVHPSDWLNLHATAAEQAAQDCTSCHRHQSFCLGCHQRAGVGLSGPYANFAGRGRFHPPASQWTQGRPGPGHHAWEAQRNLNTCASCHVERDCAVCHATTAMGGTGAFSGGARSTNPHPPGFFRDCGSALRSNARPCLVCHAPADPNLGRCR
jgi:hypothetical protein